MAVASVSMITSASPDGWTEVAELGLERARQSLCGITGTKNLEEKAAVEDGEIVESRVTLQLTPLLDEERMAEGGGD